MKSPDFSARIPLITLTMIGFLLSAVTVLAQTEHGATTEVRQDYDRLRGRTYPTKPTPQAAQIAAATQFRAQAGDLALTYNPITGVTATLFNRAGYLSDGADSDPETVALDFIEANLDLLGLIPADLAGMVVTDNVYSKTTGATHLYFGQMHQGLPVFNGQLHVNVNRDGRIISVNNGMMPQAATRANSLTPTTSAAQAVQATADHLNLSLSQAPRTIAISPAEVTVSAPELSTEPMKASLMWLPVSATELRLVWNFLVKTHDDDHHYSMLVDAHGDGVWSRRDRVLVYDDYKVYPHPIESPNFSSQLPPVDDRTVEIDPADAQASPFGWHDTDGAPGAEFTITRGNNSHAMVAANATTTPSTPEPDGGAGLSFDSVFDQTMEPVTYEDTAAIELFYWINTTHDILWHYGFDEPGGNFQANNYGNGGVEGDYILSLAQYGRNNGLRNNARYISTPEGSPPQVRMYLFNGSPERDGDFDHGIVIHEFGHGVSIRMIGGPNNIGCLTSFEQPGEGISDWLWLVLTHQVGLTGETKRGAGTYALGQPPDGDGVRPQPYSTDPAINSYEYETINTLPPVHSIGSVWAQIAYEVYWAMVDARGFDPDMYNPLGGAGNQRMLLYAIEGMKNTACSATFVEMRDGILQAALDNYGGEDVCILWNAFANIGLGVNAETSPAVNSFDVPASCLCAPQSAPTGVAGVDGGGEVNLSWSGSSPAYNVYRADGSCGQGTMVQIASGVTATNYTDVAVSIGETYSYQVTGVDGACESDVSSCQSLFLCGTLLQLAPSWNSGVTVLNILDCL